MLFKWSAYAFLRLVLALSLGIVLYSWQIWPVNYSLIISIILPIIYFVFYFFSQKKKLGTNANTLLGFVGLAAVCSFGATLAMFRTESNQPLHLNHLADSVQAYQGIVVSDVQQKGVYQKTIVEIERVRTRQGWRNTQGKAQITFPNKPTLQYGDKLLIAGAPDTIAGSRNPEEFDFKIYLARLQQVYFQKFTHEGSFVILAHSTPNYFIAWAYQLNHYFDQIFRKFIPSRQEYGVCSALILGVKDGLDNEVKTAFSAAGAMHILAVSGMHVVVIYQVFVFIFGFLKRNKKYGNWLFAIAVLVCLWFYALLTGWSASVLRAVTMFSFVVLAEAMQRKTNIYNTLAVSAFVLLCYNPFLLFDVGFLLSYVAVIGIVYIQPLLYERFSFTNRIADYLWENTCVSVAAQIATFPLGLYYFHQFPNYFLLSNLFLIPISTIAMFAGLILLLTFKIPYLNLLVSKILYWSIWLLNHGVMLTEKLPMAITEGIDISALEAIGFYAIVVLGLLFLAERKMKYWAAVSVIMLLLMTGQLYEDWQQAHQQRLAVYFVPRQSAIGLTEGRNLHLVCADSLLNDEQTKRFRLYGDWYKMGINAVNFVSVPSPKAAKAAIPAKEFGQGALLRWNDKNILLVNKKLKYGQTLFVPQAVQYIIIQNNSLYSLQSLVGLHAGQQLILDTSNKAYRAEKLAAEAAQLHLRCHNVWVKGAYVEHLAKATF